jgi:hypothetical protein
MAPLRNGLLLALVVLSAAVVVASPAFATPNLTASSGTGVATPFITPITSTTSPFTARSTSVRLTIDSVRATVTCNPAQMSGYVAATHTQAKVTSVSFGNGRGRSCTVTTPFGSGTVDRDYISCNATSARPWSLHIRRQFPGSFTSWDGTLNATTSCSFVVTAPRGSSCDITIPAGQSISARYTNEFSLLEFDATSSFQVRVRNISGCLIADATYAATLTGIYPVRPDTDLDLTPQVTEES